MPARQQFRENPALRDDPAVPVAPEHWQKLPMNLPGKCLPKNASERRIGRDEFEAQRQRMAGRMQSQEGRSRYKRRAHAAETPFAVFKTVMNFRQFLLRGLAKVNLEQRWISLAYNLTKLTRHKSVQRSGLAAIPGA